MIGILKEKTLTYPEPNEWVIDINGKIEVIVECEDYPIKHSTKLIDLIEVGDFVNGKEIIEISYFNNQLYFYTNYCPQTVISESDLTNKIKTILTHEQYKSMVYKVGEE